MKLLALDVGDRRIGVAVSDATGWIAMPVAVIRRTSKAEDSRKIARLVQEHGAQGLVIGHPVNKDGSAGSQAQRVERYAAALLEGLKTEGLDVPAVLWDERMSTQRAQEAMIATGRKARHRQGWVDAVAAAVILQDYLDEKQPALVTVRT